MAEEPQQVQACRFIGDSFNAVRFIAKADLSGADFRRSNAEMRSGREELSSNGMRMVDEPYLGHETRGDKAAKCGVLGEGC